MSMKIGLLIQGPFESYGKTGSTISYSSLRIAREKDAMKFYNCVENIQKICEESKDIFFKTVVSTWKDDKYLDTEFQADEVIYLDNEDDFTAKVGVLSGPRQWNNVYKQAKTTYEGVLKLNEFDCDYIVKIRTDMSFDLNELHEIAIQALNEKKVIGTNELRNGTRFLEMDDMILGAEAKIMTKWFESLIKWKFHWGSHDAFIRSLIWAIYGDSPNLPLKDFYTVVSNDASEALFEKAKDLWNNKFLVIPNSLWRNATYRGEIVESGYYDFVSQSPQMEPNEGIIDVSFFLKNQIGDNWVRLLLKGYYRNLIYFLIQIKLRGKGYLKPIMMFRFKKRIKKIILGKD